MTKVQLTRRAAILTGAAAPLAATLATAPSLVNAAADMKGAGRGAYSRIKLGGFEVTTLLDGTRTVEKPQEIFGMNASSEEFAAASVANFIPTDKSQFFFTPTVVNTGSELVLFDTGLGQGGIVVALAEAGYTPEDIDVVVLTHMHPDHIGGMMTGDVATFPNARYITGTTEYDFWSKTDAGNNVGDMVRAKVAPMAEKMSFLDDGGSVASGITAMAAFGHTPGHMSYMLESEGQQMLLMADLANHYVWSLGYPDWEVRFDMDKAAAAASRRRVFDMLSADKIPFVGYHMP
ncbi:MAG: MBL fold metallo-hydrolase, partial [Pseudoruegeria sp.]